MKTQKIENKTTAWLVSEFERVVCAHLAINSVVSGNTAIVRALDPAVVKAMIEERDRLWMRKCMLEACIARKVGVK